MRSEVTHSMKTKRFWSKRAMIHTAFRLPENERQIWRAAAMKAGISLNEFVREALKEKSSQMLSEENQQASA